MLRLTDLREILRYIPQFRDRVFVVGIDGAVVDDANFSNLLLDVALLRSLRIGVAIVHGAGQQVRQLAAKEGVVVSSSDGTGITNDETLQLSITASTRVTHQIVQGLADNDLRAAQGNFVVAHPAGILGGVDHQNTGRVERVDAAMLKNLIDQDIIPIIPPLGYDGEGATYRLNSDAVAVEIAKALQAVKLIYLAAHKPPRIGEKLLRHVTLTEATDLMKRRRTEVFPVESVSKLDNAVRAAHAGIPRIHIIDGAEQEGILAEVFSHEGIGTLVHANEYQSIRKAQKRDLRIVYGLMQRGMEADELLKRTRGEVERHIDDFFVFEVDKNPVACCSLHLYPDEKKAEIATVYVDGRHENQGIGLKLIRYAEGSARERGVDEIFCLSTQAINFFVQKGGFRLASPDDLPASRRETYDRSGRKSQVLVKKLSSEVLSSG